MIELHDDVFSLDTRESITSHLGLLKGQVRQILNRSNAYLEPSKQTISFPNFATFTKKKKRREKSFFIDPIWQSPITYTRLDKDGNIVAKKTMFAIDYLSMINKPRKKDSWVSFSKRYGKTEETETKWKTYLDYCKSGKFKKWKQKVLRKYKYKCVKCGTRANSVHHLLYRRWGEELVKDGIAVCWPCHMKIHENKNK